MPDETELWHGVYLVQFSNGCHKVGYSSDVPARIARHAREAANHRVYVQDVAVGKVGTEADARQAEAALIASFSHRAGNIEAHEYFYGIPHRVALTLLRDIVPTAHVSEEPMARLGDVATPPIDVRSVREELRAEMLAEGWIPPEVGTTVEWAVRYGPDSYSLPTTEAVARHRARGRRATVVVRSAGPWIPYADDNPAKETNR